MKKLHKAIIIGLFMILPFWFLVGISFGAVIVVPDDQDTIQLAVNAASAGDEIQIKANTYAEKVTISADYSGGGLTITNYGSEVVTISGGGSPSRCIVINGSDYVTVSNIILSGSVTYPIRIAGGTHNTFDNCTITGVASTTDKWVYADGNWEDLTFTNNTFSGYATYDGPFQLVSGQGLVFRDNDCDYSGNAAGTATIFFGEWLSEEAAGTYNYVERNYFHGIGSQHGTAPFMFREIDNFYFRNNVIVADSDYPNTYAIAQIRGMTDGGDSCDNFYFTNNTIDVSACSSAPNYIFLIADTNVNVKITNNLIIGNFGVFAESMSPLGEGSGNLIEYNFTTDATVTWANGLGADFTVQNNTSSQSVVWNNTGDIPSPFYDLTESLNGGDYAWDPTTDYDEVTRADPPDVGAFEYTDSTEYSDGYTETFYVCIGGTNSDPKEGSCEAAWDEATFKLTGTWNSGVDAVDVRIGANDRVIFLSEGGDFAGDYTLKGDGSAGKKVVIDGLGTAVITGGAVGFYIRQSYIDVRGFTIHGTTTPGIIIFGNGASRSNIDLRNITIYDAGNTSGPGLKIGLLEADHAYTLSAINIYDSVFRDNHEDGAIVNSWGTAYGNNINDTDRQGFTSIVGRILIDSDYRTANCAEDCWGAEGGGIFSYTYANEPHRVMIKNPAANQLLLTENPGNFATLSAGEWDFDSGKLYVRLPADIDPDTRTMLMLYGIVTNISWEDCESYENIGTGAASDGCGFYIDEGVDNATILRVNAHDNDGPGVCVLEATNWSILSSIISGNGVGASNPNTSGIAVGQFSDVGLIYNNTIYGSDGDGIQFWNYVGGTVAIKNNIISGNGGWGISDEQSAFTITENYNLFHDNTSGNYVATATPVALGANSVTGDPLFTNAAGGDFTLKPNSPARHGAVYIPGFTTKLRPESTWPSGVTTMEDILSIGAYGVYRGSAGQ